MMTSRRSVVTICLSLVAAVWTGAQALSQVNPASPSPDAATRPTVAEASHAIRWDTYEWIERRYKIESLRFHARDESGVDWLGSDEVMVETADAKGWTVSEEIGGIDSGDTHNFDPAKSCIVAVRPGTVVLGKTSICSDAGEAGPLGFQVEFWEKDTSPFGGFCIPGGGEHSGPYCADDTYGDDFIGRARIEYSTQELEAALPTVGNEQIESVTLDPCPGQLCAGFPDYTFTWRVTRLPDGLVNLGTLVSDAMKRSGARSELEAIAAGLRFLRAPNPSKRVPDTVNGPEK
jgi:hypothetical protein